MNIDLTCRLTLHPGYIIVLAYSEWDLPGTYLKFTLQLERAYNRGSYKQAALYDTTSGKLSLICTFILALA